MNNKKGFTLIELLAVIVILAIILAIAVPDILKTINNATRSSFESNAKMLLQQLYYETLKNDDFDPTTVNETNLSSYKLSSDNYETLTVSIINNETYLYIKGKNKWSDLTICGTRKNIAIVNSSSTTDCQTFNFGFTNDYQPYTVSLSGNYKLEAWGASGGGTSDQSVGSHKGLGGYTNGQIYLNAGEIIYVYVGGEGKYVPSSIKFTGGGYNGGGNAGGGDNGGGGGATDFRLTGGDWYNTESIYSRIMVAAGGGGDDNTGSSLGGSDDGSGGAGGGLVGENARIAGIYSTNTGGTQTMGTLGKGANATLPSDTGGGGGGYRGGFATNNNNGGAGGGSAFISGYSGCDAIDVTGTNTGQPNHFSGKIFTNMAMIAGTATMPNTSGGTETGHLGNGYARITYIGL